MKWSRLLIPTLREVPKDAEATSHKLMLRAGLIRKLMAGVYSYLPLGYRVLQKITAIIRAEMNSADAQELLLPALHPADIWQKTGRYDVMQDILMTVKKDGKQEIVLGPTHEEIITELAAGYISSYKDLPITLYQIQNKFRDEARPRFGVIRSKEFTMKDAYSFDTSFETLDVSYQKMYKTYQKIFDRCGLQYSIVSADAGDMGGDVSHEFMVKLPFGEDYVVSCTECALSTSLEVAACKPTHQIDSVDTSSYLNLEEFATPQVATIDELTKAYQLDPMSIVKTLIYMIDDTPVACLVRGDCEVCEPKLKKQLGATTVLLAGEHIVREITGSAIGFAGPVGLDSSIRIIADHTVFGLVNFVVGANKTDAHLKNVNYDRDFVISGYYDCRYIQNDDQCPNCDTGRAVLDRSLEIGHVFKLGTKYSSSLGATFLDQNGKEKNVVMGCYGIGVNRILAACIELHHDENGITWPLSIAPFEVNLILINAKEQESKKVADQLYDDLIGMNIDVIYDDRSVRPGVKFKDTELIGIPLSIVIGERNLKNGQIEMKIRKDGSSRLISVNDIKNEVAAFLSSNR